MKHTNPPTKVCSMLFAFVVVFALVTGRVAAAEKDTAAKKPAPGFSFVAVGDSRPMMYLPPKGTKPDLVKLFVEMFGLVMKNDWKRIFAFRQMKMDLALS